MVGPPSRSRRFRCFTVRHPQADSMKFQFVVFALFLSVTLFALPAGTAERRPANTGLMPAAATLTEVEVSLSPAYIKLSWEHSHDNIDIEQYRIYRNKKLISTVSKDASSFVDLESAGDSASTYFVTVVDAIGVESGPSNTLTLPGGLR